MIEMEKDLVGTRRSLVEARRIIIEQQLAIAGLQQEIIDLKLTIKNAYLKNRDEDVDQILLANLDMRKL